MIFQTTFNNDEYDLIVNFINNNYDNIEIKKTICGATYERQKSVKELSSKVDVLLVVGGKKSSNTKKLYDISKKINKNTYLITELNDLDKKVLKNAKSIGITAGASTPKESIEEIENKIKSIKFEEEE
jgi:4-hydroxy-3-methylbut-2-enyl diphosphate reductase